MTEKYNILGESEIAAQTIRSERKSQQSSRINKASLICSDLTAIGTSFLAPGVGTWWMEEGKLNSLFPFYWAHTYLIQWSFLLCFMAVAVMQFWWAGHYSLRKPFWDELREVYKVLFQLALINAFLLFLRGVHSSPWLYGVTWLMIFILVPGMRVIAKKVLKGMGLWSRPTVIVGCGANAVES
nr:hypothetical protein [Burkholderiales bacterium]